MQMIKGQYHEDIVVIGPVLKRLLSDVNHTQNAQGPVVQKVDNAIHRINHYPADNAIGFRNTTTTSLFSITIFDRCYRLKLK